MPRRRLETGKLDELVQKVQELCNKLQSHGYRTVEVQGRTFVARAKQPKLAHLSHEEYVAHCLSRGMHQNVIANSLYSKRKGQKPRQREAELDGNTNYRFKSKKAARAFVAKVSKQHN